MQDGKEVRRCSIHSIYANLFYLCQLVSTSKESMTDGEMIINCYPKAFAALNHSKTWVAGPNLSLRYIQLPSDC